MCLYQELVFFSSLKKQIVLLVWGCFHSAHCLLHQICSFNYEGRVHEPYAMLHWCHSSLAACCVLGFFHVWRTFFGFCKRSLVFGFSLGLSVLSWWLRTTLLDFWRELFLSTTLSFDPLLLHSAFLFSCISVEELGELTLCEKCVCYCYIRSC